MFLSGRRRLFASLVGHVSGPSIPAADAVCTHDSPAILEIQDSTYFFATTYGLFQEILNLPIYTATLLLSPRLQFFVQRGIDTEQE